MKYCNYLRRPPIREIFYKCRVYIHEGVLCFVGMSLERNTEDLSVAIPKV